MRTVVPRRPNLSRPGTYCGLPALVFTMAFTAGCGANSEKGYEVTGTVSYQGSALSAGVVALFPQKGRPLDPAKIGPDGVYHLQAPAGSYRVAVVAMSDPPHSAGEEQKPPEESAIPGRSPIPQVYGNPRTSGLQITVKADMPNKINLPLKGK